MQQCLLKSSVPAPSSLANTFGGVPEPAPASCPGATGRVGAGEHSDAPGVRPLPGAVLPPAMQQAYRIRAPVQWVYAACKLLVMTFPPSSNRHPHTFPAPRPAAPPPCLADQYRPTPQQPCISGLLNDCLQPGCCLSALQLAATCWTRDTAPAARQCRWNTCPCSGCVRHAGFACQSHLRSPILQTHPPPCLAAPPACPTGQCRTTPADACSSEWLYHCMQRRLMPR